MIVWGGAWSFINSLPDSSPTSGIFSGIFCRQVRSSRGSVQGKQQRLIKLLGVKFGWSHELQGKSASAWFAVDLQLFTIPLINIRQHFLANACPTWSGWAKGQCMVQRDLVVDEDNFPALGSQASTPPHRAAWSSPPKLDITQKPASLRQSNQAVSRPKADSSAKGVPHGRRSSEHLQQQTTDRGQAESPAVPWVETGKPAADLVLLPSNIPP